MPTIAGTVKDTARLKQVVATWMHHSNEFVVVGLYSTAVEPSRIHTRKKLNPDPKRESVWVTVQPSNL
jgi:hypothetical protein